MQNEIKWQEATPETEKMVLSERGLDFSRKTAFFFYLSGLVATASLGWVIALSIRMLIHAYQDPTMPKYYVTVAFMCLGISFISLYSFIKMLRERHAYNKHIEIDKSMVNFRETTVNGVKEWKEKLKRFDGVYLKHYAYRGVESWYIALVHPESSKSIPLFAPTYEMRTLAEKDKREMLARYGSRLNLITVYEKQSAEV